MTPPPSILVLGATGMLGSTVVRRLRTTHPDWVVRGASQGGDAVLTFDAESGRSGLLSLLRAARCYYAINCAGVLKNAIEGAAAGALERGLRVNALFPHELADVAEEAGVRVLHVSSDAVFSGRSADAYRDRDAIDPADAYGMTKALGESRAPNVLNLRCSVVGRDGRRRGLIEWYLGAPAATPVIGYTDYVWTPATTVQVADFCAAVIASGSFDTVRSAGHVVHLAPNPPLSKHEFLNALRRIAGGPAVTPAAAPGGPCRRVLTPSAACAASVASANQSWPGPLEDLLVEFSSTAG